MIVWLTTKRPCSCGRLAFIEIDDVVLCEECIRMQAQLHPENQSLQITLCDIGGAATSQPKRHSRKRIADIIPPPKRLYYAGGMWTTRED